MLTAPSPSTAAPRWVRYIHWPVSHPFRVSWHSTAPVSFSRVHDLVNSLNERKPVTIAKDGQEVEESCGRALVEEMDAVAEEWGRAARGRSETPTPRRAGPAARRDMSPPTGPRAGRDSGLAMRTSRAAGSGRVKKEEFE